MLTLTWPEFYTSSFKSLFLPPSARTRPSAESARDAPNQDTEESLGMALVSGDCHHGDDGEILQ